MKVDSRLCNGGTTHQCIAHGRSWACRCCIFSAACSTQLAFDSDKSVVVRCLTRKSYFAKFPCRPKLYKLVCIYERHVWTHMRPYQILLIRARERAQPATPLWLAIANLLARNMAPGYPSL